MSYLGLLPQELRSEILLYIESPQELFKLSGIDYLKDVFQNHSFWISKTNWPKVDKNFLSYYTNNYINKSNKSKIANYNRFTKAYKITKSYLETLRCGKQDTIFVYKLQSIIDFDILYIEDETSFEKFLLMDIDEEDSSIVFQIGDYDNEEDLIINFHMKINIYLRNDALRWDNYNFENKISEDKLFNILLHMYYNGTGYR